jgi:hypothetical protein
MHWALSGLPQKPATALGKKAEAPAAAAADAKPAAPKCLEGVRRALKGVAGPPDKADGC